MAKITEYPEASSFDQGDVILKDGVNGTKKMTVDNLMHNLVPPVDATLTQQGKPADAKKVGDEFTGLKSALAYFEGVEESASPASDWEQGEFATATGDRTDATNRIRTKAQGLPVNIKFVEAINGYKFLIYCWSDTEYLGIWTGSTFTKTYISGIVVTSSDLTKIYTEGAKHICVCLMRETASETISPSEGVNLIYTIFDNDIDTIKGRVSNIEDYVDDIKVYQQTGNLYQARTDDVNNRYYYRSNGALAVGINTDYVGFIVPVLQNHTYSFTKSRSFC